MYPLQSVCYVKTKFTSGSTLRFTKPVPTQLLAMLPQALWLTTSRNTTLLPGLHPVVLKRVHHERFTAQVHLAVGTEVSRSFFYLCLSSPHVRAQIIVGYTEELCDLTLQSPSELLNLPDCTMPYLPGQC